MKDKRLIQGILIVLVLLFCGHKTSQRHSNNIPGLGSRDSSGQLWRIIKLDSLGLENGRSIVINSHYLNDTNAFIEICYNSGKTRRIGRLIYLYEYHKLFPIRIDGKMKNIYFSDSLIGIMVRNPGVQPMAFYFFKLQDSKLVNLGNLTFESIEIKENTVYYRDKKIGNKPSPWRSIRISKIMMKE